MKTHIDKQTLLDRIKASPVFGINQHLFVEESKPVKKKRKKYGNAKVEYEGVLFDSKKECVHYQQLKVRELIGEITNLELQPIFELIPKNGDLRKLEYKADFRYVENGQIKVVDVKSLATRKIRTYINKKKLLFEKFGITIIEV